MKRNKASDLHEVGAVTMRRFILKLLAKAPYGVLDVEAVKAAVFDHFSPRFTKYDRRRMKGGKLAKWENNLAWAQATAHKLKMFSTLGKGRHRIIVNLTAGLPMARLELVLWAAKKRSRNSFIKQCPDCLAYHLLASERCDCGYEFPVALPRI